jgi:signal transduction histidine kinase
MVQDEGFGIAPEDLPHVREPFFRSPQARQRWSPGVGLGLAVAQRIVTALGGRMTIASESGKGSRFVVWLPLRPVPEASERSVIGVGQPG